MTALILARAGVNVRLLDRATFPRDKLCGDTLNPGSMALLERLGGWGGAGGSGGPDQPSLFELRRSAVASAKAEGPPLRDLSRRDWPLRQSMVARIRSRALRLTGMTVTGPGGECIAADYPGGLTGASLTRREMDLIFVEAAAAAGASVDTGVTVLGPEMADGGARVGGVRATVHGRAQVIPARIVIAADGRGSRLAAALSLSRFARQPRRWAYGAYFSGVANLSAHGEMHLRRDGYIGVAPLPDGIANVCVVRERPRGDQRRMVRDCIAADAVLRQRFAEAVMVSQTTVLGPLAIEGRAAGCPGLLLAGDAAGFVDPMTGDGLRFALRGAELAAGAALAELASGTPAWRQLGSARAREFSSKWRVNRALRGIVGSGRALGIAEGIARWWPGSVEYLIGVAGDVSLARAEGSLARAQG
jgi:flavin-dependent dehydrogenase